MKIYYIHHSSFIVETNSSFLIFDYFKSKNYVLDYDFDFEDFLNNILKGEKEIYVFSSHSHQDHFSKEIFSWENNKNIHYILSSDIKVHNKNHDIHLMKPNEEIILNNLKINTFGSTDIGVSFLINVDSLNIFHAGDLNWWKWKGDTKNEEEEMENNFKNIIDDIIKKKELINVSFFPVDFRLEGNYILGGEYFIKNVLPEIFIPMHFWDNFNVVTSFKNSRIKDYKNTKVIEIHHPNEILNL